MGSGSASHEGWSTAGCSSCLPFCFWGSRSRVPASPERRRRRRRRFRLRLRLSLSWFSWPWLRKRRGGTNSEAAGKNKGKSRRKLLLLLLRSLQAKKELASVSAGSSFLAKLQAGNFGDAKAANWKKARQTVDDDVAPTTRCAKEMAPALPEAISQPSPRPADGIWRAPSSRFHSLQLDRGVAQPCPRGLWTAATTLGMIVFLGRVTAVFFLCSCMYGARWWFEVARTEVRSGTPGGGSSRRLGDQVASGTPGGGSSRRLGDQVASGTPGGGSSRRLGDQVASGTPGGDSSRRLGDRVSVDYLLVEEHRKKVAMYGLLDRAGGKRTSSRFCL